MNTFERHYFYFHLSMLKYVWLYLYVKVFCFLCLVKYRTQKTKHIQFWRCLHFQNCVLILWSL